MRLPVRLVNDPILRQKATPVSIPGPDDILAREVLNTLISDMFETMRAENGMGLAANQVGSSYALFVLNTDGKDEVYLNPEILEQSEEIQYQEACLSIPGASGKTTRFNKVFLKFYDLNGQELGVELTGKKAIAVQHEMDHLNGKLYIDQFGPMTRMMILDKHKKYFKMMARRGLK